MKNTARLFKSVADETRLRILLLLADYGELCVCALMAALNLPQSTVSRHLAYLKNSGWLQDRRGGIWMYYSLATPLSAIQNNILASVRDNLPEYTDTGPDRERLQAHLQGKSCS